MGQLENGISLGKGCPGKSPAGVRKQSGDAVSSEMSALAANPFNTIDILGVVIKGLGLDNRHRSAPVIENEIKSCQI